MKRSEAGFTMIELMITLLILGIVASIAVPAYRNYVLRANRTEARSALLALAAAEEKYYLQCNTYVSTLDSTKDNTCAATGVAASMNFPSTSERGYYTITVTAANANTWTATATAVSSQPQSKDSKCQYFYIDSSGQKKGGASSGAATTQSECWAK